MRNTLTVLMALLVVAAMLVAAPAAAAFGSDNETQENEKDVLPGEQLAGVVSVQDAEVSGDVSERTFGIRLAQAASDEAKADVVADQLTDVEQRLEELETRANDLQEARESGEISEGQYRAQMATVAAEKETVKRLAGQSQNASEGLPADLLEERGINATQIQTLMDRADELGGEEIAEIARSIAGPSVGEQMAENASDRAADRGNSGNQNAESDSDTGEEGEDTDRSDETADNSEQEADDADEQTDQEDGEEETDGDEHNGENDDDQQDSENGEA